MDATQTNCPLPMKLYSSFYGLVDITNEFIYMNTGFSSHIPKKRKRSVFSWAQAFFINMRHG